MFLSSSRYSRFLPSFWGVPLSFSTSPPEKRCKPGDDEPTAPLLPANLKRTLGVSVDQLMAQLRTLLEWFGKLNQPSNIEEIRATRRRLITAGYRSAKASVFFLGAKLFLAIRHRLFAYTDSGKGSGISRVLQN